MNKIKVLLTSAAVVILAFGCEAKGPSTAAASDSGASEDVALKGDSEKLEDAAADMAAGDTVGAPKGTCCFTAATLAKTYKEASALTPSPKKFTENNDIAICSLPKAGVEADWGNPEKLTSVLIAGPVNEIWFSAGKFEGAYTCRVWMEHPPKPDGISVALVDAANVGLGDVQDCMAEMDKFRKDLTAHGAWPNSAAGVANACYPQH